MSRALIFANGDFDHPELVRSLVQPADVILAADGGARHAASLGLLPSAIIGDLDSLSASELRSYQQQAVQILRFPVAKDETDLELALAHALHAGHNPILILGAFGGRLDQTIGNLAMLTSPQALRADIRLEDGLTEAFFVTSSALIHGSPGETVSFIPWGLPVEAVSTAGLAYPLNAETLFPHRTRSISNRMLADDARVTIGAGLLLCIHIRNK
ncbi:MAG TPA: thiamine diphosphokinase [Anaerolineales bacterium]|jgi:thiamine pyrophosphokinase